MTKCNSLKFDLSYQIIGKKARKWKKWACKVLYKGKATTTLTRHKERYNCTTVVAVMKVSNKWTESIVYRNREWEREREREKERKRERERENSSGHLVSVFYCVAHTWRNCPIQDLQMSLLHHVLYCIGHVWYWSVCVVFILQCIMLTYCIIVWHYIMQHNYRNSWMFELPVGSVQFEFD